MLCVETNPISASWFAAVCKAARATRMDRPDSTLSGMRRPEAGKRHGALSMNVPTVQNAANGEPMSKALTGFSTSAALMNRPCVKPGIRHLWNAWSEGRGVAIETKLFAYIVIAVVALFVPTIAQAQAQSPVQRIATSPARQGQRIRSLDGKMLFPLASNVLGSDTAMHLARDSESALDVSAPQGSPVYAACVGKVTKSARDNAGGYGNNIIVFCTETGLMVWTGHHDKLLVRAGQAVTPQTVIGTVGMTGVTSFSHIHVTLRTIVNGEWHRPTIERYWPMQQFHWRPFANPKGKPWVWGGAVASGQRAGQRTIAAHPWRTHLWWVLALCIILLLRTDVAAALVGLRGKGGALVSGMGAGFAGAGVFVCTILLLLTPATATVSGQAPTNDFQRAHAFVKGWEGWQCTEDGAHTFGGVTQATYSYYLKMKGLRPADVCTSLTKQQAEEIYYRLYWLESGAHRLPWPLSAAHYDTAVGSGTGRANAMLRQCLNGSLAERFVCYQRQRIVFYLGMKNKTQSYRNAWVKRTNDLTRLVTSH